MIISVQCVTGQLPASHARFADEASQAKQRIIPLRKSAPTSHSMAGDPTATIASNPVLSANQAAKSFSAGQCLANGADFTGHFARKTTTPRPKFRRLFRQVLPLLAQLHRAAIVEWSFEVHIGRTAIKDPAHLPVGPANRCGKYR
jgi:hypothetical protein